MPLQIRPARDPRAIALVGELDAATAPDLDAWADTRVAAGETLVLDLRALEYLDSAGIRSLLRLEHGLRARAAKLELRDMTPGLQRTLLHSGLGAHFTCHQSGRRAVESA